MREFIATTVRGLLILTIIAGLCVGVSWFVNSPPEFIYSRWVVIPVMVGVVLALAWVVGHFWEMDRAERREDAARNAAEEAFTAGGGSLPRDLPPTPRVKLTRFERVIKSLDEARQDVQGAHIESGYAADDEYNALYKQIEKVASKVNDSIGPRSGKEQKP